MSNDPLARVGGSYQFNPDTGLMELVEFTADPSQARPTGYESAGSTTPPSPPRPAPPLEPPAEPQPAPIKPPSK